MRSTEKNIPELSGEFFFLGHHASELNLCSVNRENWLHSSTIIDYWLQNLYRDMNHTNPKVGGRGGRVGRGLIIFFFFFFFFQFLERKLLNKL